MNVATQKSGSDERNIKRKNKTKQNIKNRNESPDESVA